MSVQKRSDDLGIELPADGAAESDSADLSTLLVRHDRALLRYIMTLIPRRDDAEEILQRTAVVLCEKFAEFDAARPFLPWALRFAYFEALNFRKQMARDRLIFREEVLQALAETRQEQEPVLQRQRAALSHCVAKLTDADRELLQRRYCDAATIASLAEHVGRTVKSLYRRLDRVREAIVRCVDRQMAVEPAE